MKLYTVKNGTKGKLIDTQAFDASRITDWTVRGEHDFTETIIDPIRLRNHPDEIKDGYLILLAATGYAVFASEDNTRYMLAVKYNQVEIMC